MASAYKSYPEVEKVQSFLNDELTKGVIAGEALEVDGKWGPLTTEAFWAWLATQPEGSDVSKLAELGVLTADELAVINKAWAEHNQIVAQKEAEGSVPKTPPAVPAVVTEEKKGWGTMTWVLIGAAVAGAGLLGYWWVKKRKALPARAMAGLDELGEPEDFGEGTMVSLGAKKRSKRGKKSLGCGCGG